MIRQNFFRNYFTWGVFILLAALAVAAAGSWPQLFGHTANEIEPIVLEKTLSCAGTSCHLDCDPGYAAFSGSCTTSETNGHWNLFGASSDHKGWDCVDGTASHTSTITIDLTCVKTSFNSSSNPFCGNYVVESPEVCDGPNIKDIDCEDYVLNSGTQLCNGSIGACANTCDGVNISQCEYCDTGDCTVPGEIKCADGTCAPVCDTASGGPLGGSGNTLDSASTQSNWYYPPGPPLPPGIPGPGPIPFCGDGIVNGTDQCEPPGQSNSSCPGFCMECPPGSGTMVMFYGNCSDLCQCEAPPACGGVQGPLVCTGPGQIDPSGGVGTFNP